MLPPDTLRERVRRGAHSSCTRGRQPTPARPAAGRSITTRKENGMTDHSEERGRVPALEPGGRLGVTRRTWLTGVAAVATAAAGPFVWTRRAGAAGKVVIRTIGGAYEEANVKAIFEPFTKATGIGVVKVPASLGQLRAMFE